MMHNFITYVLKRGDFLKSCWSKWTCKQVAFFCSNCERGKDQHLHVQTACVTIIIKWTTKTANSLAFSSKLCDNTTHRKGLVTWPGLASSAKVTFIPSITWVGSAWSRHFYIIEIGSSVHEQCVACCPVSCFSRVITWNISSRDPGIALRYTISAYGYGNARMFTL